MSECIVKMKNILVQRAARKNVLNIAELVLHRGELLAVIGPNGAGKSTLLQVINLLQAYQGEFELFGSDVRCVDKTLLRRRSAMVFQDTLLINDTVFNNVALALRFRGIPEGEIKTLVYKALADFHCGHLVDRPALLLSGGEAKRVCIARALVTAPELLLLDEPFAALDVTTRDEMIEEIRKIAEQRKIAVVLVSHNFAEVLHFAERVVVICNGSIVQDDKPEILMRRPVNTEVAKLVGMDNIIPCQIKAIQQEMFIHLALGQDNELEFVYQGANFKDANYRGFSACCIAGDDLYLYDKSLAAEREKWLTIVGIIERVMPGVGSYKILVAVGEEILCVRMSRPRFEDGIYSSACIILTFNPDVVHII